MCNYNNITYVASNTVVLLILLLKLTFFIEGVYAMLITINDHNHNWLLIIDDSSIV